MHSLRLSDSVSRSSSNPIGQAVRSELSCLATESTTTDFCGDGSNSSSNTAESRCVVVAIRGASLSLMRNRVSSHAVL